MDQYLQVFVKVVEKGNFSKAAEELHMTQPAVSQYIKVLEESVGARLLERSNKYVRLNKAGEIVYHHAKEIIALYSKMQYLVDDLTNNACGLLQLGQATHSENISCRTSLQGCRYTIRLFTPTIPDSQYKRNH